MEHHQLFYRISGFFPVYLIALDMSSGLVMNFYDRLSGFITLCGHYIHLRENLHYP